MIVKEAIVIIVGVVFLFSLWVGWNDKDYDKHYLIRGVKPAKELYLDGKYIQRANLNARYMEIDYWHLATVQEHAKKLAKIKFPNAEIREMFGVYQIKLKGKWHNIACSANGKYLYVGWDLTERQKERYRENNSTYRDYWDKKKEHSSSIRSDQKRL